MTWASRGSAISTCSIRPTGTASCARLPVGRNAGGNSGRSAAPGPLLAVTASDDPDGTPAAVERALVYYTGASKTRLILSPDDLGVERIGHFDLFHSRHRDGFWRATAGWLESGGQFWALGSTRPQRPDRG